jgi:hypothetical protein
MLHVILEMLMKISLLGSKKSVASARTMALQTKIAQNAARADIEIYCDDMGDGWYNLYTISDPEIVPTVAEAVEYLAGMGKLMRHPVHASWVRPIRIEILGASRAEARYGEAIMADTLSRLTGSF